MDLLLELTNDKVVESGGRARLKTFTGPNSRFRGRGEQWVMRHLPSATYATMVRLRGRAAERGRLGEHHHPLGNEQMPKQRSIWSGLH